MKNLKLARKAKKLTQAQTAEKLGVFRETYARYESGQMYPTVPKMFKLAEILGVSVDYLFGDSESAQKRSTTEPQISTNHPIDMHIKQFRVANHETQKQLADAIGIDRVSVARYETGERMPPLDKLMMIADHYHASLDEIVGRSRQSDSITPEAEDVAAHTDAEVTPAMEARLKELIAEAFQKYGRK